MTVNITMAAFPPPVSAPHAMVVSADKYATQAGINILRRGGNAIDAAVAVGYALAVAHPCCGNLGGGGFMLIHLKNGETKFLDFRETAPAAISPQLFLDKQHQLRTDLFHDHALMWGIPGTVRGLNAALKTYGTMSLPQVIKPALNLARNGYRLQPQQLRLLNYLYQAPHQSGNLKTLIYHQGRRYQVGEIFRQPNLANTLKLIATKGDAGFYQGKVAAAIVNASKLHGGVISARDLRHYRVVWRQPISCHYRGYQIITAPPPGSGVTLCEMLHILEPEALNQWGFLAAKSIHYNLEAMRYAFADRNHYLGDSDYHRLPLKWLLSAAHATSLRQKIKPNHAGNIAGIKTYLQHEKPQTTHYSIVDKAGNAVAVTYSLNGFFGSYVIPGNTGFFMNNTIDDFTLKLGAKNIFGLVQGRYNLVAPEHRPLSSMSPTMVTKDNKLRYVLGTPGGSTIITQILLAIENVVDYHMNIAQAIDQCRYHMQDVPDQLSVEPFCFSPDTLNLLEKMGYEVRGRSTYFGEQYWGGVAAIAIDPTTRRRFGAMDIRRPGGAALGD